MCTVQVTAAGGEPIEIELLLDTGSAVSILPESVYLQCFNNVSLTEPKPHLVSYLRNLKPVRGCLHADVTSKNYCAPAEFHIMWSGTAILGRDLVAALDMQLLNGRTTSITQSIANQTPVANVTGDSMECTLGCAKGFVHLVKMRPNVTPVQQKLSCLPLSVRCCFTGTEKAR